MTKIRTATPVSLSYDFRDNIGFLSDPEEAFSLPPDKFAMDVPLPQKLLKKIEMPLFEDIPVPKVALAAVVHDRIV